jgi:hypothetical protein
MAITDAKAIREKRARMRTEFFLHYLEYKAGFARSSFAAYMSPLSYADWLECFDIWVVNRK